jgi:carbonic anhydrase/acetyltransferase-like protein (isoleucine patch superfamily)
MMITIEGRTPRVGPGCFIAPGATLIGDVEVGEGAGIWFGAVVRGDVGRIRIGRRTNIQDLCVLHVEAGQDLEVGDDVTVGHRAILHGCRIASRVLIGMGSVIMNGATIGEGAMIGAGALVTEGTEIPPRSLVLGVPARVSRELSDSEEAAIAESATRYHAMAQMYIRAQGIRRKVKR